MLEDNSSIQLLCDEDPFLMSPMPCPPPPSSSRSRPVYCGNDDGEDDEARDQAFRNYMCREKNYAPRSGYLKQLQCSSNLSSARFRAMQYIIQVCNKLGLATGTACNAANYVDRFLSMNSYMKWEGWMVELLSIACLSIASKLDEVNIPSLQDLQTVDLDHSFVVSSIMEMELTVVKALDWRLCCVTPHSYVDLLHLRNTGTARATNLLLLHALLDPSLLRFNASTVATSALRCAAKHHDACLSAISRLIPGDYMDNSDACERIMDVLHKLGLSRVQEHDKQWSPVSVIPHANCSTPGE
ncbi:putative cyclin-D7-1 [Typha latifolia]|uniref:putative cyclin-D7-1 n=1 Tax=Typha latifolia TaxID=4733 RepID=UPI003C2BE0B6